MNETSQGASIYIIGAGISGLIAAINLEKSGHAPVILEADNKAGGRVQTDIMEGYQLDRGFQVLLEAYPLAKKYLDYDALNVQPLMPGAWIYESGKAHRFGDPLRDSSFLLPTIGSSIGTLTDKWKVFKLNQELKKKTLEDIFQATETTTLQYLKAYGFSDRIIDHFFRPFFSGIYLEPNLETSSRMFEYVYKMFGDGSALIPKAGMGAIPAQLASQLKKTRIHFNTRVTSVSNEEIRLHNGETLKPDFTIIATDPQKLVSGYVSTLDWKSCDNLYFTVPSRSIAKPVIGLNARKDALVNNIFFPTSIEVEHKGAQDLLSITVVKDHELEEDELVSRVNAELERDFGISGTSFLKRYLIESALPKLDDLQYSRDEGESLLTDKIAMAGDHPLNGSLNAAMISGEAAAQIAHRAVAESLMTFG